MLAGAWRRQGGAVPAHPFPFESSAFRLLLGQRHHCSRLQARGASEAEWRLLMAALLASCSLAAARAWLGYVPANLQSQAAHVISQLTSGVVIRKSCLHIWL